MKRAQSELARHVVRLAVWSTFCLLLALAPWVAESLSGTGVFGVFVDGVVSGKRPQASYQSFLVWTAGWCLVNLAICLASWVGKPPDDLRKLREFLTLNLGLNVGYIGTGLALALAARAPEAQGAGAAVAVQGLALLVLDAWLLVRLPVRADP